MYERIQLAILAIFGVIFGLSALSARLPHVDWLQGFRLPKLSEAQRRQARRQSDRIACLQFIMLGLLLPMGYVVLKVMMFSSFTTTENVLVLAGSVLCIGLGIAGWPKE